MYFAPLFHLLKHTINDDSSKALTLYVCTCKHYNSQSTTPERFDQSKHVHRASNPFSSPAGERKRGAPERPEDDYQIPSSNLCLSQPPICISVPSRYWPLMTTRCYHGDVNKVLR